MSSLEAVNKTLGRIEEDTDLLNRNFQKWFLIQERSKLDAEEDRRERNKLLAMLGTAGAAGAGRAGGGGGGGGKAGGGMNPLGFLNNLPPWAKLLLGVYAGKAAIGAYKVIKSPQTLGEKIGQSYSFIDFLLYYLIFKFITRGSTRKNFYPINNVSQCRFCFVSQRAYGSSEYRV